MAGILFGPHTPGLSLVDDPGEVAALSGLGLVFLLFRPADDELLVVCFVGVAVTGAAVAHELGVSDAIGAVLGGSGVAPPVHELVLPLRDAFEALFFFVFALSIDPGAVGTAVLNPGAGPDSRVAPFVAGYVLPAVVGPLAVLRSNHLTHLLPQRLFV